MSLFFVSSEIRRCKLLRSRKKNTSSRFDRLFYGMFLTTRTKMGMIRQSYNWIDGINFGADAKRFTHKDKEKITHVNSIAATA